MARTPQPQAEPPAVAAPKTSPPVPAEEPQEFKGKNGETMFGVPNRSFELRKTMKRAHRLALEHADEAFDELDTEFDDF